MRKLIAAMKLSADGLSEGPDGYADWVDAWSDDYGLMERVDACLIGGGMYPGYEQYWSAIQQTPHSPLPMTGRLPHARELIWSEFARRTPHYVLSTRLQNVAWPHTTLLRNIGEIGELRHQTGKDIYLMGGAMLTGSLVDAGLVDEIHFIVSPLLVGPSKSPFNHLTQRRQMQLMAARTLDAGRVHLAYRLA